MNDLKWNLPEILSSDKTNVLGQNVELSFNTVKQK